MLNVNYLLINIKNMKVTITEQHLNNIIAESVKKRLFEFNHMLYGDEPEPEYRYGTIDILDAVCDHFPTEVCNNVKGILDKYQLPTSIDVRYPDSGSLDDNGKKKYRNICAKLDSIVPADGVEEAVLKQYKEAIDNLEEYQYVYDYYGDELKVYNPYDY